MTRSQSRFWACQPRPATQHLVSVRRGEAAVATVLPVAYLELLRSSWRSRRQPHAAQVHWAQVARVSPPPEQWSKGDEPKSF